LYQSALDARPNQRYFIKCPDGSFVIPPGKSMPVEIKEGAKAKPIKGDGVWRWAFDNGFKEKSHLLVFKESALHEIRKPLSTNGFQRYLFYVCPPPLKPLCSAGFQRSFFNFSLFCLFFRGGGGQKFFLFSFVKPSNSTLS